MGFFWRAELGDALLFGFVMGIAPLLPNRPPEENADVPVMVDPEGDAAVRLDEAPRDEDAADRP